MPKSSKPVPDAENPEWTAERFARAKRFHELPADLQHALTLKKRGPQKSPVKKLTTIRLSQDVLTALRSKGRGWQTLADETLRSAFVKER